MVSVGISTVPVGITTGSVGINTMNQQNTKTVVNIITYSQKDYNCCFLQLLHGCLQFATTNMCIVQIISMSNSLMT